jgi:hypothetical protein
MASLLLFLGQRLLRTLNTMNIRNAFLPVITVWFLLAGGSQTLSAQVFSDATNSYFPLLTIPTGVSGGEVMWVDFNLDGNLDMVVNGNPTFGSAQTQILLYNPGSGNFDQAVSLSPTLSVPVDMAAGDLNDDGYPDLVVSSRSGTALTRVYLYNSTNNTLNGVNSFSSALTAFGLSAVDLADFNNDGELDLAVVGRNATTGTNRIHLYRNVNGANFQQDFVSGSGVEEAWIEWGDFDRDGDQDLLIGGTSGPGGSNGIYRILRKGSSGNFTLDNPSLIGLHDGGATWADFDNDGDLDIVAWGEENGTSNHRTLIYRNDSVSGFVLLAFEPTGIKNGQVALADYDNDGWRDLILIGNHTNTGRRVEAYLNDQGGSFYQSNTASNDLEDQNNGARLAFGDIDNDGRLDLMTAGDEGFLSGVTTLMFENDLSTSAINLPPPSANPAAGAGSSIVLSWTAPTGLPASISRGLTYAVYGRTIGGQVILSPGANLTTGARSIPQDGPISGNSLILTDLAPGNYQWGVQAVGANFDGSLFTPAQSFTITSGGTSTTSFTEVTNTGTFSPFVPAGINQGDLAWGDLDNDGDLDLVASGTNGSSNVSYVYRNLTADGMMGFEQVTTFPFMALTNCDLDLVDIDNDNDLDLAISGSVGPTGRFTRIYENTNTVSGTISFNTGSPITLPGGVNVAFAAMAWGDIDGDGDQDLVLTGQDAGNTHNVFVFDNRFIPTGIRSFADSTAVVNARSVSSLPPIRNGMVELADFNQDGFPDLIISGNNTIGGTTGRVYLNDPNAAWGFNQSITITGRQQGDVSVGDLNNDGSPDFVLTGKSSPSASQGGMDVYLYDGGSFTSANLNMVNLYAGSVDIGDYNDDGWPDLAITGSFGADGLGNPNLDSTYLFRNTTSPPNGVSFAQDGLSSNTLTNLGDGSRAYWGDYDNDEKLDLALMGESNGSRSFRVFRNIESTPNQTLAAPNGLVTQINGFQVNLSWNPPPTSSGTENGLSYSLWVRQVGNSTLLRSPLSSLNTGFRKVAELGNVCQVTSYTLRNLSAGAYQWRVQAIDQDHEGSAFSPIQDFTYERPSFVNTTIQEFQVALPIRPQDAAIAAGDYSGDSYPDLAVMGKLNADSNLFALYRYVPTDNEYIREASDGPLPDLSRGAVAFGDINQDNLPDLAYLGEDKNGNLFAQVRTNAAGTFTSGASTLINLAGGGLKDGDLAWADYNNDGYPDLVITGENAAGQPITRFLQNNRLSGAAVGFVNQGALGVLNLAHSRVDWGDINQDGWLDLAIMGEDNTGTRQTAVYLNNTRGGFTALPVPLTDLTRGDLAWGDFDADGWLDLAITGQGNAGPIARIYHNSQDFSGNGGNAFALFSAPIVGTIGGSLAWGDYNSDGYLDLVVSGQNGNNQANDRSIHLYRYESTSGQFVDEVIQATPLDPVNTGSQTVWLDYNLDGKLDLVVCGRSGAGPYQNTFGLFQNININPALVPNAPSGLQVAYDGYEVALSWTPPTGWPAPVEGLSYNVVLDNSAAFTNPLLASPLANLTDGCRRVFAAGKTHDTTAHRLYNLPNGTYHWRVQAIGPNYRGSVFSSASSFPYKAPVLVDSTDQYLASPGGLEQGDLTWVDIDLDGDLDLFAAGDQGGTALVDVFQNNGGTLTPLGLNFQALRQVRAAWADVDGDLDPDAVIMGEDNGGNAVTLLYRNNGNGVFTSSAAGLDPVRRGDLAFIDDDNDGDLDLVIIGERNGQPFADRYRNDGNGNFAARNAGLAAVSLGSVAVLDFNQDFLPDFLVMGRNASNIQQVALYQNDGRGSFREVPAGQLNGLIGYEHSSVDVADYDQDGFPDLLVSGRNGSNLQTRVLHNESGSGEFTTALSPPGMELGDARWGDVDDDGYPEFAMTGLNGSNRISAFYDYNGSAFTNEPILADPILPSSHARLAWGDFNQDGKLDLVMAGRTGSSNQAFRLLRNVDSTANRLPAAPTGLTQRIDADTAIFSWNAPANSGGYTYNLYVRRAGDADYLVSPLANLTTGRRRVALRGNAGGSQTYKLVAPPAGTLEWGVQAIDVDFEGSAFATGADITYERPDFIPFNRKTLADGFSNYQRGALAWGDADGDGRLDLLVSGQTGPNDVLTQLLTYNALSDRLEETSNLTFTNLRESATDWADYDRDGDLDFALIGEISSGQPITALYRNAGDGTFTRDTRSDATLSTLNLGQGDLLWIDHDNDGDLDLLLAGSGSLARQTVLLENDGQGIFTRYALFSAPGLSEVSLDRGDFDRDGNQDLAIMGFDGTAPFTAIYRNLGFRGGFVALTEGQAPLPDLRDGALAWADVNRDGYLDLVVSGIDAGGSPITELFLYNEVSAQFEARIEDELRPLGRGHLAWGDYNDDGFSDLLHFGEDDNQVAQVRLYTNENGNALNWDSVSSAAMEPLSQAHLAWGDADLDGKLDVVALGTRSGGQPWLEVYHNQNLAANQVPLAPTGLSSVVQADSVILTWQAPASSGQTFNLLVGTDSSNLSVISPMADVNNGLRQVAQTGHASLPRFRLMGLDDTTYYWQVQRIGADLEGSPFSSDIGSFEFVPPHFTEVTGISFDTTVLDGLSEADVAWADLDRDGDLDFVVAGTVGGTPHLDVYLSEAGRGFSLRQRLPGLSQPTLGWGDFDRDGRADLLLMGTDGVASATRLYRSQGDSLSLQLNTGLPNLREASLAWGDMNHDGADDLLLSGTNDANEAQTGVWLNTPGAATLFQATLFSLSPLDLAAVAWVDANRDGYLDALVTGTDATDTEQCHLYLNDAQGLLNLQGNVLPNVELLKAPSLAVADVDNNGYPDLALSGQSGSVGPKLSILLHNGSSESPSWREAPESFSLPLIAGGDVAWGDYNDDGLSDLLVTGIRNGSPRTLLLAQQQDTTFAEDTLATAFFPDLGAGSAAAWGDYNLDGKLDLLLTGTGATPTLGLFRNDERSPDQVIGIPTALNRRVVGAGLELSWQPPAGYDPAQVAGLSYQLFLQDEASGQRILPALADTATGLREVPQAGMSRYSLTWRVENLQVGTSYRWGVQAIGPDLAGSAFAKNSFRFDPPAFEWATGEIFPNAPVGLDDSKVAAADYDGDGDMDLVVAGTNSDGNGQIRMYKNILGEVPNLPNTARYVLDTEQPNLLSVLDAALAWGDFNQDNLPDLFISGIRRNDANLDAGIYLNKGGVLDLDEVLSAQLVPVGRAAAAWADYDGDGYQDLLVAGQEGSAPRTILYRNEQGRTLVRDEAASANLAQVYSPTLAWADFEGEAVPDGPNKPIQALKPDLFLAGIDSSGNPVSAIYRNQGNGTFAALRNTDLVPVRGSSAAWGFLNNDEFPDLLVSGQASSGPLTNIYQYDPGAQRYTLITPVEPLLDLDNGTVLIGDYNADGLADLVVSGFQNNIPRTVVYQQVGDQHFIDDINSTSELDSSKATRWTWLDVNNDGKLDLFSADVLTPDTRERSFGFFRNIDSTANVPPAVPLQPAHEIEGNVVSLTWVNPQPSSFLTFGLYLRHRDSTTFQVSPLADINSGYRRTVGLGSRTAAAEARFTDLPDGTYYWAVQSVGPDFEGSPFSPVDSFAYQNPVPEILEVLFPPRFPDNQDTELSYIEASADTNIERVVVHHKGITDSTWRETVIAADVWQNDTDNNLTERFEYRIPRNAIDEMGIEYYYEVIGRYGDYRAVTDTAYTYRFYASGLDYNQLRSGSSVEAYQILTVPLTLEESDLVSDVIVDQFGSYNQRQFRIFQYQGLQHVEYGDGADVLRPGEGLWLISRKTRSFNSSPGLVVEANDQQPFQWQLQPGWNQIGNPYPFALLWTDILGANPGAEAQIDDFLAYNNGFANDNLIPAKRGGFIYAESEVSLSIPVRKNSSVNRVATDLNRAVGHLGDPHWMLPIRVSSGAGRFPIAAVGMHPQAQVGRDAWDAAAPPRMSDYLEFFSRHPEHASGAFVRDVVPTADQQVWTFELASSLNEREVQLTWGDVSTGPAGQQLVLFDVEHQRIVPMTERTSYLSISDQETRHFRIYYGDAAFMRTAVRPERIHLGWAFPNPVASGRGVLVPISLPDGPSYEVRLHLMNLQGQVVRALPAQAFAGGFHVLKWDGLDGQGAPLPAGLYLYQLQVSGPDTTWQSANKLQIR